MLSLLIKNTVICRLLKITNPSCLLFQTNRECTSSLMLPAILFTLEKQKILKKRVTSYFSRNQSGKTTMLLKKSSNIHHIVVDNESDALLLENNLIKKHQPRYNILLKDDKTFPWICIRNEPFPTCLQHKEYYKRRITYILVLYTSGLMVKTLIESDQATLSTANMFL